MKHAYLSTVSSALVALASLAPCGLRAGGPTSADIGANRPCTVTNFFGDMVASTLQLTKAATAEDGTAWYVDSATAWLAITDDDRLTASQPGYTAVWKSYEQGSSPFNVSPRLATRTVSEGPELDLSTVRAGLSPQTGSTLLYVYLTPIAYTVAYKLNGGAFPEESVHPAAATYDVAFDVSAPTRTGYSFAGWQVNGRTYFNGETAAVSLCNLTTTAGATVTVQALWTRNSYELELVVGTGVAKIWYLAEGAAWQSTTASRRVEVPYDATWKAYAEPASGWQGSGTGWSAAAPQSGQMGTAGARFAPEAKRQAFAVQVKANPLEGGAVSGSGTYDYEAQAELTATPAAGYRFVSWTWSEGSSSENPFLLTVATNVTVTANFAARSYPLTLIVGEGVARIFYQIQAQDVWQDWRWTETSTTVDLAAGTRFRVYATTRTGYVLSGSDSSEGTALARTMTTDGYVFEPRPAKCQYRVSVSANPPEGGSVAGSGTYEYLAQAELSASPRDGYLFESWSDGSAENPHRIQVTGDISLSAKFTARAYPLSLVAVEGIAKISYRLKTDGVWGAWLSTVVSKTVDVAYGTDYQCYAETKPGYALEGAGSSIGLPVTGTMKTDGFTFEPRPSKISYEVLVGSEPSAGGTTTVNGNGRFSYGETAVVEANPESGYSFVRWDETKPARTGVSTNPRHCFTVTNNAYLVAVFAAKATYAVHFDGNGATSGAMADQTFFLDDDKNLAKCLFARTGHAFAGWATSPSATVAQYADEARIASPITTAAEVTLYAVWSPHTYTVVFQPGEGTGTEFSQVFTYDQPRKLPACPFAKGEDPFVCWRDESSRLAYANGETVVNLTAEEGGTVTLVANWTAVAADRTVTFCRNRDRDDAVTVKQVFRAETEDALRANDFVREGHAFAGWSTNRVEAEANLVAYADQDLLAPTADTTLYAAWRPNAYQVAFDANGGTGRMDARLFTYGEWTTITNLFTHPDTIYTFAGWGTNRTEAVIGPEDPVRNLTAIPDDHLMLYAVWKPNCGPWSEALGCETLKFGEALSAAVPPAEPKNWKVMTNDCVNLKFVGTATADYLAAQVLTNGTLSFDWRPEVGADKNAQLNVKICNAKGVGQYGSFITNDVSVAELQLPATASGTPSNDWHSVTCRVALTKSDAYLHFVCNHALKPVSLRRVRWTPDTSDPRCRVTFDWGTNGALRVSGGAGEQDIVPNHAAWEPTVLPAPGRVLEKWLMTEDGSSEAGARSVEPGAVADQAITVPAAFAATYTNRLYRIIYANAKGKIESTAGWFDLSNDPVENPVAYPDLRDTSGTFAGWSPAADDFPYGSTSNVVVRALWTEQTVTVATNFVTFVSGSAYTATNVVAVIGEGKAAVPPAVADEPGYVFAGWDQPGKINSVTESFTTYARYTRVVPKTHAVSFAADAEGRVTLVGADPSGGVTCELVEGTGATNAPSVACAEGYRFAGWKVTVPADAAARAGLVDADGCLVDAAGVRVGAGGVVSNVTQTLSLQAFATAVVVRVAHTVTFALDRVLERTGGGELVQTVDEGGNAEAPAVIVRAAVRDHYRFDGWDGSFSNVVADVTVTARVATNRYEIAVDGQTREIAYGETVTETVPASVTNGDVNVVCTGWTGTGTVPASGTGNSVTFVVRGAGSLAWRYATNYWVCADATRGGAVALGDAGGAAVANPGWYGAGTNLAARATPDEGWLFARWEGLADDETDDEVAFAVSAPVRITAVFTQTVHTVTFALDGHLRRTGGGELVQSVAHGGAAAEPTVRATDGYVFAGWDVPFDRVTSDLTVTGSAEEQPAYPAGERTVIAAPETTLSGTVTWSAKNLPAGLKIAAKDLTDRTYGALEGGTIYGVPTKPGTYVVRVTAKSGKATETFSVTIAVGHYADDELPLDESYGATVGVKTLFELGDPFAGATAKSLPTGLKFAAKATTDATFGAVAAGTVYGFATKAVTNTVIFTKKIDGAVHTASATFAAAALPAWAVGTFNGQLADGSGSATLTVGATGKASGKVVTGGKTWSFSASGYESAVEAGEGGDLLFAVSATAKNGGLTADVELAVAADGAAGSIAGDAVDGELTLWRNEWRDKGATAKLAPFVGLYTVQLEGDDAGFGYLSLTLDAKGNCKATGKLPDGTSAAGSLPLVWTDGAPMAVWQLSPGAYKGGFVGGQLVWRDAEGETGTDASATVAGDSIAWTSFAPTATSEYGAGFERTLFADGAYYDKLATLADYYATLAFGADAPTLDATLKTTYTADNRRTTTSEAIEVDAVLPTCWDALTVTLDAKGKTFAVDQGKATRPVQDKTTKEWSYEGANDAALTFAFTKATGIFKGSFTCWYDYLSAEDQTKDPAKETWTHTSKKVSYEGIMVLNGEEAEPLRGFWLWDRTGAYEDEKTGKEKTFKYRESHRIAFDPVDPL